MNSEERINQISQSLNDGHKAGDWKIIRHDKMTTRPIYRIPIDLLVYNKYNWRIASRVKSIESQWQNINASSLSWKKLIEKLLWDSRPDRNKKTLDDIKLRWQKEYWIITKDWVIIDWNRRAMLINRINESEDRSMMFEAIVLDVSLDDSPGEIHKLETRYQMWEDEKVHYNPIEKYIKVSDLRSYKMSYGEIGKLMQETENTIKTRDEMFVLMNDYLSYFELNGILTQLDQREDHFRFLYNWSKAFKKNSTKWFDGYDPEIDVAKLENICFHLIRCLLEWKRYRKIAEWNKENNFFWNKEIRENFSNEFYKIKKHSEQFDNDNPINYNAPNLVKFLEDRNNNYQRSIMPDVDNVIEDHENMLVNKLNEDKPFKQIVKATSSITSINKKIIKDHDNDLEIREAKWKLLSAIKEIMNNDDILSDILESLNNIDVNDLNNDSYELIWKIKQKLSSLDSQW